MSNSTMNMKNQTPLVTVPSRSSLRLAAVLVIAALMAFCPTLMRADTIAENTAGTTIGPVGYWGQSFTTVLGPESNIAFNFFSDAPATTPLALDGLPFEYGIHRHTLVLKLGNARLSRSSNRVWWLLHL